MRTSTKLFAVGLVLVTLLAPAATAAGEETPAPESSSAPQSSAEVSAESGTNPCRPSCIGWAP